MMLSLFATGGGAIGMYVGEAREQQILPNVQHTARFIWRVSLSYFLAGTLALWVALLAAGLPPPRAAFHAVSLFMAAFDTGGFAPNSASIGLYHSAAVETVIAVLMVAGAVSFAVHYQLWHRKNRELGTNLESRVLLVTVLGLGFPRWRGGLLHYVDRAQ
jgi:trk system potassium uptake protein TrkH